MSVVLALTVLLGSVVSGAKLTEADLIIHGGKIYTGAEGKPVVEAIAAKDGKVLAIGTIGEIMRYGGRNTKRIELKGRTVIPGLIDAHVHFLSLGTRLLQVDCYWKPKEEIIAAIAKAVAEAKPGEWIQGRGFNQAVWDPPVWPTKEELDAVSPNNPVYVGRYCGHAAWVNSKALEIAGVTKDTPDPPNGAFLRDEKGEPTGILLEEGAMNAVRKHIPPFTEEQLTKGLILANNECLSVGLTGVHDAGASKENIELVKDLYEQGNLKIRIYQMVRGPSESVDYFLAHGPEIGLYGNRYTIRSVKMSLDGALGARGCAMLEPFSDWPDKTWTGVIRIPEDQFENEVKKVVQAGFQVRVHAIGDKGNRLTLDAYEAALNDLGFLGKDIRPAIEHAQILHFTDIPRFRQLGVVASMQPVHATEDMLFAESRVGPYRILGGYAWKTLQSIDVPIAAGSDAPVSPINPFYGIHAAVTRQDRNNNPPGGWYPSQCMTREEALKAFTVGAAYVAFEEDIKGTLEPGKLADMVVIDRDIMDETKVPASEIWKTKVLKTIIGGEVVYEAPAEE